MACWDEIELFGKISKGACQVCQNPWKVETYGDVSKGKMDDLFWVGDLPVVDVDEEVDLWFSKVNNCLKICTSLMI
jgi:hypothetical protein